MSAGAGRRGAGWWRTLHAVLLGAALAGAAAGPGVARAAAPEPPSLTLDGPAATSYGHQVTFSGRLEGRHPGVTVGVFLGSSLVARAPVAGDGSFVARPRLFSSGDYRARALGLVSIPHRIRVVRPLLREGSESAAVLALVRRLDDLGYVVLSRSQTAFTGAVRQSVFAFQKAQGLRVDGIVGPRTRARLRDPQPVLPRRPGPRDHIEVDIERQLLLLVHSDRVVAVVNASTAGIPGTHTPRGSFAVFRRVRGIDTSPLGKLFDPLYFDRGYAIHGSTNVPPVAASHGCVRIPIWQAARLFETVPRGEQVLVY